MVRRGTRVGNNPVFLYNRCGVLVNRKHGAETCPRGIYRQEERRVEAVPAPALSSGGWKIYCGGAITKTDVCTTVEAVATVEANDPRVQHRGRAALQGPRKARGRIG